LNLFWPKRRRKFELCGSILLVVVGFCGCRSQSAVSTAQQKAEQPVAHQPAQARVETDQERSCREFVQGFYDWYTTPIKPDRLHTTGELSFDDVLRLKANLFDRKLLELLKEDRDVQNRNPGYITGLESDPFFNSQDPMSKYAVRLVKVEGENCRAQVWGVPDGERAVGSIPDVEPELTIFKRRWAFVNFHYPNGNFPWNDLIDELDWLRKNRSTSKK
jgi:hypothetical protein